MNPDPLLAQLSQVGEHASQTSRRLQHLHRKSNLLMQRSEQLATQAEAQAEELRQGLERLEMLQLQLAALRTPDNSPPME